MGQNVSPHVTYEIRWRFANSLPLHEAFSY
eukprot:COSAG01_NODE_66526_length_269_cov_203.917647_1_plen_29_part_10